MMQYINFHLLPFLFLLEMITLAIFLLKEV